MRTVPEAVKIVDIRIHAAPDEHFEYLPVATLGDERDSASHDSPAIADVGCVAGDAGLRLDCPQARPDARGGRNCWWHPDRAIRAWTILPERGPHLHATFLCSV